MSKLHAYRKFHSGTQPEYDFPFYASTAKRHPTQPLVIVPQTLSEITGPVFGTDDLKPTDNDLTRQHKGDPIGERIIVSGRVLDENGRPMPHTLVEVWQANAAGRYPHKNDTHNAPAARSPTPRDATASSPSGRASTPGATTTTPGGRRTSTSRFSVKRS
jgi:protocatechuate 3,4-dioxygenase, beta subunit